VREFDLADRLTEWANATCSTSSTLEVLDRLGAQGRLDWSRASVHTMTMRANAGDHVGANPLSWLSCFRRVQVRWDRDSGRFFAFVLVACALVCFNRL
jgi:hypothetical protein